jgi:predicted nucleic acid-binding Zn ribbon protein
MKCHFCEKELNDSQKYEVLRGKAKGFCSKKCSQLMYAYKSKENYINSTKRTCIVCNTDFYFPPHRKQTICSPKCAGKISSERMKLKNPMSNEDTRIKVSETLKKIKHKPFVMGGNGRCATVPQLSLYNELTKINDSFCMEYIERLGKENILKYKCPNHYKIDIASGVLKIAIEVDGPSHNSIKIKECDKKKEMILSSRGWKVLRFTNSQIMNELQNCVQTVMSMI